MSIPTGGGSYDLTVETFDKMWLKANEMLARSESWMKSALDLALTSPSINWNPVDKSFWLMPEKPTLPADLWVDGENIYRANKDEIIDLITGGFADFLSKYLPNPEFYDNALAWCNRAIMQGGTGINPAVEAQLWERGRSRIMSEAGAAEREALTQVAARGFVLPPGVLTGRLHQIRLDTQGKLAEQSRDISIKSFETEVENVRFAVEQILNQRVAALNAANDYIKALAAGPESAIKLATGLAGLKSDLARNLVSLYQAEAAALEPRVRLAITDAELRQQANVENMKAILATVEEKVKAAIAAAQMAGSMASAGLNAINASVGVSASDSYRWDMTE